MFNRKPKRSSYLQGLIFAQESSLGHDCMMLNYDTIGELEDFSKGLQDFHHHLNHLKEWGTTSVEIQGDEVYDSEQDSE